MLKGNSQLEQKLSLIDMFKNDASTEFVRATRPIPFPLTPCTGIKALLGEKAMRVSHTLEYKNGPLRMDVEEILSRKRRKNEDWGETVDIALNIRYALCSGRSGKITTPEQLLAALEELYGTEEEIDAINISD